MKPAWRGVVLQNGVIWAWPMLLMDHSEAFAVLPHLQREMRVRWRQWDAGGPVDFDQGTSDEDKQLVNDWIERVS